MRIYGIDFTSAPCAQKPITVALCRVEGEQLILDATAALESMECFHNLLASDGPWVAGMDFPFGLPRDCVPSMNWVAGLGNLCRIGGRDAGQRISRFGTRCNGRTNSGSALFPARSGSRGGRPEPDECDSAAGWIDVSCRRAVVAGQRSDGVADESG